MGRWYLGKPKGICGDFEMRIEKRKTIDGGEIEVLIPENANDERELKRLIREDQIKVQESFADNFDEDQDEDFLDIL